MPSRAAVLSLYRGGITRATNHWMIVSFAPGFVWQAVHEVHEWKKK